MFVNANSACNLHLWQFDARKLCSTTSTIDTACLKKLCESSFVPNLIEFLVGVLLCHDPFQSFSSISQSNSWTLHINIYSPPKHMHKSLLLVSDSQSDSVQLPQTNPSHWHFFPLCNTAQCKCTIVSAVVWLSVLSLISAVIICTLCGSWITLESGSLQHSNHRYFSSTLLLSV